MTVKEQVLLALTQNPGKSVSGEEIAGRLEISRNSVWKAVKQLQAEGYEIDAVPNKGYRIKSSPNLVSAAIIESQLTTKVLGRCLEIYPLLSSTNDTAKEFAAAGAKHGTVVIADSQTGGKGRRGRSFFSPPSTGIYMSVILRPDFSIETGGMATSLVAVAVSEAIESVCNLKIGIKWVNDLFCGGKKVCGILTEAATDLESGGINYMIAGIGINVARIDFPPELNDIAASLSNLCGEDISRNLLISEILNHLERRFENIETGDFLEECRRRSTVIGRRVTVYSGRDSYEALAVDIDGAGRLVVEADGMKRVLNSGEVSVKL